jgi:SAM-dependent methyltransferase
MTAAEHLHNDPRSELWGEHRSRYRFAARLVRPGMRVLDVACGAGFGLEMLVAAGACPLGVDLQAAALAEARQAAPRARLVRADATRLPLPNHAIDLAVSFETIEHVPDAAALVRELRRVVRPEGRLVLSTPNRAFRAQTNGMNPFHVREFTGAELRELLLTCFGHVELYGQRASAAYRYVPFLLVERSWQPSELAWKLLNRLPFALKDALARGLTHRPFYPGEDDYAFVPGLAAWQTAHALLAVAR